MPSEAMKQEEIEVLAREMAKEVKTEADLKAGNTDGPNFVIHTRKGRGTGDATTKEGGKNGKPHHHRLSERSSAESHTCHHALRWAAAEPAPSLTIAMKCASHSGRETRASRHMHCAVQGL